MAEKFEPLIGFERRSAEDLLRRGSAFRSALATRRSVRMFSAEPVPRAVFLEAIAAAASAPSGANRQPWHFTLIESPGARRRLREAAEAEEKAFYGGRAGEEWLSALEPFGTDWQKPFLETAPGVIVVFQENYGLTPSGERIKNYYIQESVGIACGFLIAALHMAGLAALTHTPSPMGFLREICGRPVNERAVMVIIAGYPAEGAQVPVIAKKPMSEVCSAV